MMKNNINHNLNKIIKCDWLSTVLISAIVGQCNRTVRVIAREHVNVLFLFLLVCFFLLSTSSKIPTEYLLF